MSLFRFEITQEHLDLIRNMDWKAIEDGNTGEFGIPYLEEDAPFGDLPNFEFEDPFEEDNKEEGEEEEQKPVFSEKVVEDAAMILYGKKDNEIINDPFQQEVKKHSDEELKKAREVLSGVYLALDIVCYIGEFKTGKFVTEHYQREWREE